MTAEQVAQYLATGTVVGGIYALIALGFVIVFGVTRVVNFAQGEFVMLGRSRWRRSARAGPACRRRSR